MPKKRQVKQPVTIDIPDIEAFKAACEQRDFQAMDELFKVYKMLGLPEPDESQFSFQPEHMKEYWRKRRAKTRT